MTYYNKKAIGSKFVSSAFTKTFFFWKDLAVIPICEILSNSLQTNVSVYYLAHESKKNLVTTLNNAYK